MKQLQNHQCGSARTKIVILLLVIAIFVSGGIALSTLLKKPAYVVAGNTFVADLSVNDSNTTYSMLTSRLQQQVGGKTAWSQNVNSVFSDSKVTTKLMSSSAVPNPVPTYGRAADPWRLTYRFDFGGGKTYDMYIIVLNSKGSWKVDEYNTLFAK